MNSILEAREKRVELQQSMQKIYENTLIVNRVNMPGAKKNTPLANSIFDYIESELSKRLGNHVLVKKRVFSVEGPIMIRVVDMPPETIKALTISIENENTLGRFVDLDVYKLNGESMSRREYGYEPRSCYLCNSTAHECVRSQRHSLDELLTFMESKYKIHKNKL